MLGTGRGLLGDILRLVSRGILLSNSLRLYNGLANRAFLTLAKSRCNAGCGNCGNLFDLVRELRYLLRYSLSAHRTGAFLFSCGKASSLGYSPIGNSTFMLVRAFFLFVGLLLLLMLSLVLTVIGIAVRRLARRCQNKHEYHNQG